ELDGGVDLGADPRTLVSEAGRLEDQRVARLPLVDLPRVAVARREVFSRPDVLAVSAREDLEQLRPPGAARATHRSGEGAVHLHGIVTVGDGRRRDAIRLRERRDA